jgi:UDP-N-acetylmuramoyl-L-alanyl-D-glutamate--2,6-diaminopimelate ligase
MQMVSRPSGISITLAEVGEQMQRSTTLDAVITGVTHDSEQVQAGDLFVAIAGHDHHGIKFLDQALANGAVAVASDAEGVAVAHEYGLPTLLLEQARSDMALAAAIVYGHPQKKLKLVGVTGTNGKTTVTHIVKSFLQDAHHTVGMIGTLGSFINDEPVPSRRTTPEATELYALFALMVQRNVDTVVMEVSSHALELGRVEHVMFDVAVFTNLTQDHLDFHGNMQSYFEAKAKLFTPEHCRRAVVCVDDAWGRTLADQMRVPVQTVSRDGEPANWVASDCVGGSGRTTFNITHDGQQRESGTINMLGDFNVANALEALVVCQELGLDYASLLKSAEHIRPVPGRLELVKVAEDFFAVVDYAHTPDAVEKVLTELRKQFPNRIITVIGCGGDRDAVKRPHMGRMASVLSDIVIVTDDNPRSEVPSSIRAQVLAGVSDGTALEIADRRQAIREALSLAQPGDIVAVLGKGHELGQEVDGVIYPFNDVEVLLQEARDA